MEYGLLSDWKTCAHAAPLGSRRQTSNGERTLRRLPPTRRSSRAQSFSEGHALAVELCVSVRGDSTAAAAR